MRIDALIDRLAVDGPALADAAGEAGPDAAVPGCPGWSIRDLIVHTGGIHRWATDIVRSARETTDTAAGEAVGTAPEGDLIAWFSAGHADLVSALRAAPDALRCATFLPAPSPRAFWARRQAHETAIHRADAEAALGRIPAFDATFAQDGIDELLTGFAARRGNAVAEAGTMALRITDGPGRLVTFGGPRTVTVTVPDPQADAEVVGTASDLYLWLWHRPSAARVLGDAAVAARWDAVTVTWS